MAEEKCSKLEARHKNKNYLEYRPERQRHGKYERLRNKVERKFNHI